MKILRVEYKRSSERVVHKDCEHSVYWWQMERIFSDGELENYLHDADDSYWEAEGVGGNEDGVPIELEKGIAIAPWDESLIVSLEEFFKLPRYSHAFK